jgi:hypothetical protein
MKKPKRARDQNQLAKPIVDLATGDATKLLHSIFSPLNYATRGSQRLKGKSEETLQGKGRVKIASMAAEALWTKKEEG